MKSAMFAVALMYLLAEVPAMNAQPEGPRVPLVNVSGKPLEFDVVSIREDKSSPDPRTNPMLFGPTMDGYRLRNVPLSFAIMAAFKPLVGGDSGIFNYSEILGVPNWVPGTRYDIDAKVSEADLSNWKNPALQPTMLRAMLQAMLADRFKLVARRETKEEDVFELTVAPTGPKFKPTSATELADIQQKHPGATSTFGGAVIANGSTPGQINYFGVTMSILCAQLSNMAGRPIQDKTGLTGRYDLTYQLELPPPPLPGASASPSMPDMASQVFTIVKDQLGLKLVSAKGPVEFLVIDHIERPSEN